MNHQVRFNGLATLIVLRAHFVLRAGSLNGCDSAASADLDSNLAKFLHEPPDEIRIEMRQHSFATLNYRHLRARARSDMGKLGRNVTPADHHDAIGQTLEFHKCIAR